MDKKTLEDNLQRVQRHLQAMAAENANLRAENARLRKESVRVLDAFTVLAEALGTAHRKMAT